MVRYLFVFLSLSACMLTLSGYRSPFLKTSDPEKYFENELLNFFKNSQNQEMVRALLLEFDKKRVEEDRKNQQNQVNKAILQGLQNPEPVTVGESWVRGSANAPITIVEFSSLECPYSARAAQMVDTLLQEYPGMIRHVHKHLTMETHRYSKTASRILLAAGEQDHFWEMRKEIFANQNNLRFSGYRKMSNAVGLDFKLLTKDYHTQLAKYDRIISLDLQQAKNLSIESSPVFFINGIRLEGAYDLDVFRQVIKTLLKPEE